jgi:hypothetical protein
MIFVGAAILLAQSSLNGTVDDANIQAAVTTAQKLRIEVKKRRDERNAAMGFGPNGVVK